MGIGSSVDATGQRFHRLTALRVVGSRRIGKGTKKIWKFRCDCGVEIDEFFDWVLAVAERVRAIRAEESA